MRARFGHRHIEEHAAAAILVRVGRSRGEHAEALAPAEQAVRDHLADGEHRADLARPAIR
jgi:predicted transcriptional regulator